MSKVLEVYILRGGGDGGGGEGWSVMSSSTSVYINVFLFILKKIINVRYYNFDLTTSSTNLFINKYVETV